MHGVRTLLKETPPSSHFLCHEAGQKAATVAGKRALDLWLQPPGSQSTTGEKYIFFFPFLGPHLGHMEVSRLGAESELQVPAYNTASATQGLSHVCDLHRSSRQCQILKPLSDQTHTLMDTGPVLTR